MACKCVPVSVPIDGGEKTTCSDCSPLPLGRGTTEQSVAVKFWAPEQGVKLRLSFQFNDLPSGGLTGLIEILFLDSNL